MRIVKKIITTIKNEIKPKKYFDYNQMKFKSLRCEKCFLHAIQFYYRGKYPEPAVLVGRCIWHKEKFKKTLDKK